MGWGQELRQVSPGVRFVRETSQFGLHGTKENTKSLFEKGLRAPKRVQAAIVLGYDWHAIGRSFPTPPGFGIIFEGNTMHTLYRISR